LKNNSQPGISPDAVLSMRDERMGDLEQKFAEYEQNIKELEANEEELRRHQCELIEMRHVLQIGKKLIKSGIEEMEQEEKYNEVSSSKSKFDSELFDLIFISFSN
jgi:regulator of replication initiation timing